VPIIAGVLAFAVAAGVLLYWIGRPPERPYSDPTPWIDLASAEPRISARIYWVGHSLMDHRDASEPDALNVIENVRHFARVRGQTNQYFAHTLPGSPLALNWVGESVGGMVNLQAVIHRHELLQRGGQYDVLVLTEGVPLARSMQEEHSAYYGRRFYCAILEANPDAAVYVYEGWHHLFASDPECDYGPPESWDWRERLSEDLVEWESLADAIAAGTGEPPWLGRRLAERFMGAPNVACADTRPVLIIPAGQALARLHDRLTAEAPSGDTGLTISQFFQNAYVDWPEDWPASSHAGAKERIASLTLPRPTESVDDIHLSEMGSYFVGLVAYATLHRMTPVGLPTGAGLAEDQARLLQEVAWETVMEYPRSGVLLSP